MYAYPPLEVSVLAYTKNDKIYSGCWDGNKLIKVASDNRWKSQWDLSSILKKIGNLYDFRLVARKKDDSNIDVNAGQNIVLYKTTDTSLLLKGVSADSYTVGDKINVINNSLSEINNSLDEINNYSNNISSLQYYLNNHLIFIDSTYNWAASAYALNTGGITAADNRIRTSTLESSYILVKCILPYQISVLAYLKEDKTYIGVWDGNAFVKYNTDNRWTTEINLLDLSQNTNNEYNFRLVARKNDDSIISIGEGANIKLYRTTDKSLTISGAPADAKTTGDMLYELQNINNTFNFIKNINSTIISHDYFENGGISALTGLNSNSTIKLRTVLPINISDSINISVNSGYRIRIYAYENDTFMGCYLGDGIFKAKVLDTDEAYFTSVNLLKFNNYTYRFAIGKEDDQEIYITDDFIFTISSLTDKNLQNDGAPADAKSTGEKINLINELLSINAISSDINDCLLRSTASNTGLITIESTNRISNKKYYEKNSYVTVDVNDGFKYVIYAFEKQNGSDFKYLGVVVGSEIVKPENLSLPDGSWRYDKTYFSSLPNCYYRFMIGKINNSDLQLSDSENLLFIQKSINASLNNNFSNSINMNSAIIHHGKVCTNGNNLADSLIFDTIDYYPVDSNYMYYANTRTYISEYTSTNGNPESLIKVSNNTNKGIIKLNQLTKYVKISYIKNTPYNEFLFVPINNDIMKIIRELINNIYSMPKNYATANIIASCNQFLNIEYTPIRPLPFTNSNGYVDAGTTIKGLPYSSTRSVCKYIGQHLSIYTFLSAIQNPNSVLYTRRIKYGTLGKTYYGVTCFTIVSYSHGSRLGYFDNNTYALNIDKDFEFVSPYEIEPGDTLFGPSDILPHCAIVYDVYKDEYGRIIGIYITEATPPNCRCRYWEWILDGQYILAGTQKYRVAKRKTRIDRATGLIDYASYNKIDFVKGYDDETVNQLVYPDIMSEYGDKACIEAGLDVNINIINSNGYNRIDIYKDDTLIDTKTNITDFTINNIAYGKYKFSLVGDSKNSESYLIAADVNGTFNKNTNTITFSSANATPVFAASYGDFESGNPSDAGVQSYVLRFNQSEINAGRADVSKIINNSYVNIQIGFLTEYGVAMWWSNKLDNEWEYWSLN